MKLWKQKFETAPSNCISDGCVDHWLHCWPVLSSSWLLNMKRLVILKQQQKKTSITG